MVVIMGGRTADAQNLEGYFPPDGGMAGGGMVDPRFNDQRFDMSGGNPYGGNPYGANPYGDPAAARAGDVAPIGPLLYSDNRFGDGLGYKDNYYNIRAWLPWQVGGGDDDLFFTSLGGSLTEEGDFAANFGGGYRRFIPQWNRIFGISAWYDMDDAYSDTFSRGGISLETMGPIFDLRINGYFLLGSDNRNTTNLGTSAMFQGNRLIFNNAIISENAFDGGDIEVGGLMPVLGRYGIYGYLGGYYLDSDEAGDATGVSVRTNMLITESVSVGANYTYDETFDSNFFVNLVVSFPTGGTNRFFKPRPMPERMMEPVQRQQRIPVLTRRENVLNNAVNPADGLAFFLLHVDPNAVGSANTGTFENPFLTLESARLANNGGTDIIRVVNNANLATPNGALAVTAPFGLFAGQRLLATSQNHLVLTTNGSIDLPGFTGGARPVINNTSTTPGGSVIALMGGSTEVSGFTIDGRDANLVNNHNGITNTTPVTNFNVNNNTFTNVTNAVSLTEATGSGQFNNNILVGDRIGFGGGILLGSAETGLLIDNSSGTLNLTATGNDINLYRRGIDITSRGTARIDSTFQNNTVSNSRSVGLLTAARDNSVMNIILGGDATTGNVFTGNLDSNTAVLVTDSATLDSFLVAGNTFQTSFDNLLTNLSLVPAEDVLGEGDGLILSRQALARLNNINIGTATVGNLFAGNGGDGVEVFGTGAGNVVNRVGLQNNIYTGNGGSGACLILGGDSIFVFNSNRNTYTGNTVGGLFINTFGNASIGDSLSFNNGNPTASASVFNSETFTANNAFQAQFSATNQSWQNILFSGTNGQRTVMTGGSGIGLGINNDAVASVGGTNPTQSIYTIFETDIINPASDGINAIFTGAEANLITGNGNRAGNNILTIGAAGRGVTISGAGEQGVDVTLAHFDTGVVAGTPAAISIRSNDTINLDSLITSGNTDDGFQLTQTLQSGATLNVLRSQFRDNQGAGMSIDNQSGSTAGPVNSFYNIGSTAAGAGNLFQGNQLQGLFVQTLSPIVAVGNGATGTTIIGDVFLAADPQIPQLNPLSGFYASQNNEANLTFTRARLNVFGNSIIGNGGFTNTADGLAVAVGTNTNMIAAISGNTLGGNAGADINFVSVRSQEMNASVTNAPPVPDVIVADAVGFLDLALGTNFAAFPPNGSVPNGSLPNNGTQFLLNTRGGSTPLDGRTELGIYTTADTASGVTIKPANRSAFMVARVFDSANLNNNVFTVSGPALTTVNNANVLIGGARGGVPQFNTVQLQPVNTVFP